MKRALVVAGIVLVLGSGCAANIYPGGPTPAGILVTHTTTPAQSLTVATDSTAAPGKKGEASATAILGLVAFGDAGLDAAMRDGGIKKVHHVDHKINLYLWGLFLEDTTVVYGE